MKTQSYAWDADNTDMLGLAKVTFGTISSWDTGENEVVVWELWFLALIKIPFPLMITFTSFVTNAVSKYR